MMIGCVACVFPYYMNLAAGCEDKVERMKFVITATLSSFFWTASFMKPVPNLFNTLGLSLEWIGL